MSGFNFPPNISGFGRSLMNRASAAGTRLLLQLGDMAIQNANNLGALHVTDTTPSTSTTTGAFTVAGGLGAREVSTNAVNLNMQGGGATATPSATASQTFHVSPTGNNTTGNGSAGAPWATIQYAVNYVASINWGSNTPTIQLANGTYTESVNLRAVSGASPFLVGNTTNPELVVINASTTDVSALFMLVPGSFWRLRGVTIIAGANRSCISLDNNASLAVDGPIRLSGSSLSTKVNVTNGARYLHTHSVCTILDGSQSLFRAVSSSMNLFGLSLQAPSPVTFATALIAAETGSLITWTGPGTPIGTFDGPGLLATNGVIVTAWNSTGLGPTSSVNSFVSGAATNLSRFNNALFELTRQTVAQLQAAIPGQATGSIAYCTNEADGAVPVFFDGTNWRRSTDRAVIS